jgi:hypothetical protein
MLITILCHRGGCCGWRTMVPCIERLQCTGSSNTGDRRFRTCIIISKSLFFLLVSRFGSISLLDRRPRHVSVRIIVGAIAGSYSAAFARNPFIIIGSGTGNDKAFML